jgi:tungstate transport system substrate-binding protein
MGRCRTNSRSSIPLALLAALVTVALTATGCGGSTTTSAAATTTTVAATTTTAAASTTITASGGKIDLTLASTTSTKDSGLFDVLIPAFNKAYPRYNVKVVAVGSGEALKLGQDKNADVLLVHSPAAEVQFMKDGYGISREPVAYNDFVIVGPSPDPGQDQRHSLGGRRIYEDRRRQGHVLHARR